jgi:hypothetical protein
MGAIVTTAEAFAALGATLDGAAGFATGFGPLLVEGAICGAEAEAVCE